MKQEILDRRLGDPEEQKRSMVEVAMFTLQKRGTWGAEATRAAFPGVRRRVVRQAVRLGRRLLARCRRQGWIRVRWAAPDVAWSMDAMKVGGDRLLILQDECSRLRLRWELRRRWTAQAVAAWLGQEFQRRGAPLVLKSDNEGIFREESVGGLLNRWGVVALPSPVRRPRYNGKCERGIGEVRAWLAGIPRGRRVAYEALVAEVAEAIHQINGRRRPVLGDRTAREVYRQARRIVIDRWGLKRRVEERKRRILESTGSIPTGGRSEDKLHRRATVEVMRQHGLLEFGSQDGGEARALAWAPAAAEGVN